MKGTNRSLIVAALLANAGVMKAGLESALNRVPRGTTDARGNKEQPPTRNGWGGLRPGRRGNACSVAEGKRRARRGRNRQRARQNGSYRGAR